MTLGNQLPEIPLGEIVLNVGGITPLHKSKVIGKSGTTMLFIVTTKVIGEAHWPELGVNK